eukprot:766803-Hanusia_phi.AAC.1
MHCISGPLIQIKTYPVSESGQVKVKELERRKKGLDYTDIFWSFLACLPACLPACPACLPACLPACMLALAYTC